MKAVITGASRGLGKTIASYFARSGYDVYLVAKNARLLEETADAFRVEFPTINVHWAAADLADKQQCMDAGERIVNDNFQPDVLVNNAGTYNPGSLHDEPDGALEMMLGVNLYSAYHLTRKLLPPMMRRRSGHIFNICSIASLAAYPGGGSYSISKYALAGFSKNLRHELQPFNIKVTTVYPGAIYTDSWKGSGVSEERIMTTSDIASLVFAASQLSPAACLEEIVVRPQLGDL